eukprot:m.334192 g.334192  ORF g.334192 m.334192 type:complete len:415 (+) comp17308_c0_seq1:208-1452(+)
MIHSIYVLNSSGDLVMEKHYRSPLNRGVLDPFFEVHAKCTPDQVPSTIYGGKMHLINVYHKNVFVIAVVKSDVPTLFVIEFLHRIIAVFTDYFGSCTEQKITQHVVIASQVLEEMLDNGFPLATEPNILKEMIRPPTWTAVFDSVTGQKGVREKLPSGTISNTQWRRAGVKYSSNECFVDIEEHVDCITDKFGHIIYSEIRGVIVCRTKLSGMPDLCLSFVNPRILDDVSFHPCVRLQEWNTSRVLSFIPPDGQFQLCQYLIGPETQINLPLNVRPTLTFDEERGRLDIEIAPNHTGGKVIEDFVLTIPMPKQVNSCNLTPTLGNVTFDQVTKTIRWDIKKIPSTGLQNIRGSISTAPGSAKVNHNPPISVSLKIPGHVPSGVKVNRLDITCEKYKPFKGVKYTTHAGRYQIRT